MKCETDTLDRLRALIDDAGIEYFRAEELGRLNPNAWSGDAFELPPTDHLNRIIPTLEIADEIRERWGGPIRVVSGYRPPAYNRAIGGADQSQHIAFKALDLKPAREPFDLQQYFRTVDEIVGAARNRGTNIGVGWYYGGRGRFVHVDVGAETGVNREWYRRSE